MGDKTGIQWTDATWNPVTGCSHVSAGCKNCYAEKMALRLQAMGQARYADGFKVRVQLEALDQPLRWKRPRRIFVNSMSDLFHEEVPDDFIEQVFAVMALAHWHTYQVLTKRAERMLAFFRDEFRFAYIEGQAQKLHHARTGEDPSMWLAVSGPLPNVWLGVSVEDQANADKRIPLLLKTPAAVRFISAEPLLGPLKVFDRGSLHPIQTVAGVLHPPGALHWVICGGESGPGARPFEVRWAESLRNQCATSDIPFFLKQLGADPRWAGAACSPTEPARGKCGDPLEWPEPLRVQQFPEACK